MIPIKLVLTTLTLWALLPLGASAQAPDSTKSGTLPQAEPGQSAPPRPAKAAMRENLPPAPAGASTVIGGEIREVDQVLDTLKLKIPGGKSTTIFFDARTRFFRNGVKVPLADLRAGQHVSVQTTLDGTDVFAVSIHMLSSLPTGECHGQILSFNPRSGILSVRSTLSTTPIELRVPPGTPIARQVQALPNAAGKVPSIKGTVADLAQGALVEASFLPGHGSRGTAQSITILAQPGSSFEFTGKITYLNLSTGKITLVDPRTSKAYPISFSPAAIPNSASLHEGEEVNITASFDGQTYTARKIAAR